MSIAVSDLLNHIMNYHNNRHQVLTNNISRVNMPKERAFDLQSLTQTFTSHTLPLTTTRPGHISSSKNFGNFKVVPMADADELTLNGNNINLEQQTTKLAENSTDFNLVTSIYKKIKALRKLPFTSHT